MESLTRLVSESLARHGFDRPLDYRRLHWSRWFRCESHHSLLLVPSKPGVFALAEEIIDFDSKTNHVAADATIRRAECSSAGVEERCFSAASSVPLKPPALAAEQSFAGENIPRPRRMLAVTQFFEDDDMAFVLDRMLARPNPMRDRLASGRYFVRFVVIEDGSQRRSICSALNQWIANQSIANQPVANQSTANASEKASGIGSHFASSLELTPVTEFLSADASAQTNLFEETREERTLPLASSEPALSLPKGQALSAIPASVTLSQPAGDAGLKPSAHASAPQLDSGAASKIHCPSPFPSGF
jgi:hypothetical protein